MSTTTKLISVLIAGLLLHGKLSAETVGVFTESPAGQLQFAAGDVEAALKARGYTVERPPMTSLAAYPNSKVVIALTNNAQVKTVLLNQGGATPAALGEQGYHLQDTTQVKRSYWVLGGDLNGAMYGGLQAAEYVAANGLADITAETVAPRILRRGAKLNLSLDQRLPTYAGNKLHTSSAFSIPAVWDMAFWKDWLDQQARNRMNLLTVWVHNPFPALVIVPEFEKATLPFIMGTSEYPVAGGEQLTISKRIDFWKEVMRHAKERGFEFYFFNWNVTPDYAKDQGIGITDSMTNATTKKYFNNAVKKLLETYPDLDGFGVSPGDNMGQIGSNSDAKKAENAKWIFEAYNKGIADFAKENPNRKFTFVHRQINVELATSKNYWKAIEATYPNLTLDVSMKYCNANTYSTTTPEIASYDLDELADFGGSTWLTLRNDGFFYADFGNPTWVRAFISHLPSQTYTDGPHQGKPLLRGVYLGHDAYSPTYSYLYKNEALNRNDVTGKVMLEIQRKWYMEMLWGRLAYNPNTSDDAFRLAMAQRYPTLPSATLFTAWSKATGPIARIEELVQGTWNLDSEFYHELCMWRNDGNNYFRTIRDFVWDSESNEHTQVAKGSEDRLASIKETADGKAAGRTTAFDLANEVEQDAWTALTLLSQLGSGGGGRAEVLIKTLQQQAFICTYYAYKIRGAIFKEQGKLVEARNAMGTAYGWWMRYVGSMNEMWKTDKTRTYDLTGNGGWIQWNAQVLKEFQDLGGSGTPALPELPKPTAAPVITSSTSLTVTAGQAFVYQITATNTPTTYGASGLPANVTVNSSTGQVSGTITTVGQVSFTVTATNTSGTGSQLITVTVSGGTTNTPPTITNLTDRTVEEDKALGPIAFTISDQETAAASLILSVTSSNTALVPTNQVVFGGSGANRTLTVTPLPNQHGKATITVTVSDGSLTDSTYFALTVTPINDAPARNNEIPDQSAVVDVPFSYVVPANTFTDVDHATLTWSASGLPAWLTFTPGTRAFTGTPTTAGQTQVTVTVSDGSLTATDVFTLTTTANADTSTIKINFQPQSAPTVTGYGVDSGKVFGLRPNGLTYGWNYDLSDVTRDRNSSQSPDQLKDTLILTQKNLSTPAKWEIVVPNGTYEVRVVAGDAGYFGDDMNYCFTIEGVVVLNQKPSSSNRWVEDTDPVVVQDGRMTIENGATAVRNRLCFIEISKVPAGGN